MNYSDQYWCVLCFQSKVIRVLNLWQKNNVFPMSIIQPLMDLAADPNDPNVLAKR